MNLDERIAEVLVRLDEAIWCDPDDARLGREEAGRILRAFALEVEREAIERARKTLCRNCSDGDEPMRGMHRTVVGDVECYPWPLRALLPPAAEAAAPIASEAKPRGQYCHGCDDYVDHKAEAAAPAGEVPHDERACLGHSCDGAVLTRMIEGLVSGVCNECGRISIYEENARG